MRRWIANLALSVSLIGNLAGQTTGNGAVEGVVTLADSRRHLLVIQDEAQTPRAFKLDDPVPDVQPGERVRIHGEIAPYFTALPEFPQFPAGRKILSSIEVQSDWSDHFIARLRGFLMVPADGTYTFWIMADDEGELLLGSDSDPASARRIAMAPQGTWPPTWDHDLDQKSQPVHLKAGQPYYIEARQREWRGHDRLAVAWESAGIERQVIGGTFLTPWQASDPLTNGILYEFWTNCFITRLSLLAPERQLLSLSKAQVELLGSSPMPPAPRLSVAEARSEPSNFLWVEVQGTVTFAAADSDVLQLELSATNAGHGAPVSRIRATVLSWGNAPLGSLLNRNVRVRGVCERTLDAQGQPKDKILWIQNVQHLWPQDYAEDAWRELKLFPISEITATNLDLAWGRHVKVRGNVRSYDEKTRRGLIQGDDTFYSYTSEDGEEWKLFGTPVLATMSDPILSGLAASSFTTTQAPKASFSHLEMDLDQSKVVSLSAGEVKGTLTSSNGVVTLAPIEGNDWSGRDEGMFLCQRLAGEGQIVAHLESFETARISDKAGLMMRESNAANAPYVAIVVTHGTRLDLLYRHSSGSLAKPVQRLASTVPRWLKLVRRQHALSVEISGGGIPRPNQSVELVGSLIWTNGEPMLVNAHARSPERLLLSPSVDGLAREVDIAQLPATAAESEQYLDQDYLVRGVVTFKGRAFGKEFLVLQDNSGALSLRAAPVILRSHRVEPGCVLEAKGGVLFAPGVAPFRVNTVTVLGTGALPIPVQYSDQSAANIAEGVWTEATGIVRWATNNVLSLMERGGPLLVWVGRQADRLPRYVDCLVKVRGVFSSQVTSGPALLVTSPGDIQVMEYAPGDPFAIPSFFISRLNSPEFNGNLLHRMKLTAVVTYQDANMMVVQDHTGGARVWTGGASNFKIGDRVEVVGFSSREGEAVTMRNSEVRKVGDGSSPEPIKMMMEGILEARLNCWLVRLDGTLLDQKIRHGRHILELQNGQRVFEALLDAPAGGLKAVPVGSRVQVTGVTQLQIAGYPPVASAKRDLPIIATMNVLMRTPADMVLLERPPWWTWRHTAIAGGLLLAILIAALGWIGSLHQRVAQRTSELKHAMQRLQQETELSATLAERERLAAEIHDTVEQGLNGIMMQLDGMDSRLPSDAQGARQSLEMARRMLRFSRSEMRHSLWNLESPSLKEGNLGAALAELANQMSAGSSSSVKVEIVGNSRPLSPAVEHHLLRCAQESLNNALKHSQGSQVRIELRYGADLVEVAVADNGRGFDPDNVLTEPGRHLGLRNLRTRARKLKGQLQITSRLGEGTRVRLAVPLDVSDKMARPPASN